MHNRKRMGLFAAGVLGAMALCSCRPAEKLGPWRALFDGKTLAGWKVPVFGGDGRVYVKDGAIHMERGAMCTGATWTGPIPRDNYEIAMEAMRVDGGDFFCGLTFPVGKDQMTLILGGWGGTLVGLSCIDGYDASENEVGQSCDFKNGRWYRVRVRVTKANIRVWLDGERIIDLERAGRKFSIRAEVELSVPLGIATWITHGAARNIRIRDVVASGQ